MAGSTINGDGKTTSVHQNSDGSGNPNAKHHPDPIGNRTYRVTIDVRRIQDNVFANEGGRLSELAVCNWLRSVGFRPEASGATWLGDIESLNRLDKSEILRSERVYGMLGVRAG